MNEEEGKRKAVEWRTKAAEQGDVEAQSELGRRYYFGDGVVQDHKKAVEWYEKAAKQGYAHAQCCLGWCYEGGEDVDYEKAVYWYAKAARQGHAGAQYNLGRCYYYGNGVIQSYGKAVEWYTKAAEQGVAVAQYKLGLCYEKGKGVKQDQNNAAKWFTKAAEQRYANAGEDRAEEDGAKGVGTKGDGGDGYGCSFIIIAFLLLCIGRVWLHDRDGHSAQESVKAMEVIKKNRKTRGTYEVWRAWRKYKDNMEEKNYSMVVWRAWRKYKDGKPGASSKPKSKAEEEEALAKAMSRAKVPKKAKNSSTSNSSKMVSPGEVYSIYDPEAGGGIRAKIVSVNPKAKKVTYTGKDGEYKTVDADEFGEMYRRDRDGWRDSNSSNPEPQVNINTEGSTIVIGPIDDEYKVGDTFTNSKTGEKLFITGIKPNGEISFNVHGGEGWSLSGEAFESILSNFMAEEAPVETPDETPDEAPDEALVDEAPAVEAPVTEILAENPGYESSVEEPAGCTGTKGSGSGSEDATPPPSPTTENVVVEPVATK